MNWIARVRNPYFWLGIGGVVLTAMGAKPEMFTSWTVLMEQFKILFGNPFLLGSVAIAVLGVLCDPTTEGVGDGKKEENKK